MRGSAGWRRSLRDGAARHGRGAAEERSKADRGRVLAEASANLERVSAEFDALATEPVLAEAATEIDDVRIALQELRGALQAQVDAAAIDPELLRRRSSELRSGLEAFRRRLSPPAQAPEAP